MKYAWILAAAASLLSSSVQADSCWNHNGSIVRLIAIGQDRTLVYQKPRVGLQQIGVYPGRVLFTGTRQGQTWYGNAKQFSNQCPGEETTYRVTGTISPNQTRVVLRGSRPLYNNCVPTGRYARDILTFQYLYQCSPSN